MRETRSIRSRPGGRIRSRQTIVIKFPPLNVHFHFPPFLDSPVITSFPPSLQRHKLVPHSSSSQSPFEAPILSRHRHRHPRKLSSTAPPHHLSGPPIGSYTIATLRPPTPLRFGQQRRPLGAICLPSLSVPFAAQSFRFLMLCSRFCFVGSDRAQFVSIFGGSMAGFMPRLHPVSGF